MPNTKPRPRRFEAWVLEYLARAGEQRTFAIGDAYDRTGGRISGAHLYATLRDLQAGGLITSGLAPSTDPRRGRRPDTFWTLTTEGQRRLNKPQGASRGPEGGPSDQPGAEGAV